jgi:hypothetical protein
MKGARRRILFSGRKNPYPDPSASLPVGDTANLML